MEIGCCLAPGPPTWSKLRSSQGLPGVKGPVRVKGFQMGSVRPTSW